MIASQRRAITRNREMLACTECRKRKLRCDRNAPCSTCTKRGDEAACKHQRFANGSENGRERRHQAEARLEHLEQLVQQLARPGPTSNLENTPSNVGLRQPGQILNGQSNSIGFPENTSAILDYSGSTHWSAMLEDIEELRYAITPAGVPTEESVITERDELSSIGIIFGSACPLSYHQVLNQYLPPRQEADRLVAAYFRSKAIAAPFIHAPQFRRQYSAFWRDPENAPPLWTSIFFSICYIASTTLSTQKPDSNEAAKYSNAAAYCLVIGQYTQPRRFAVESLLLFGQSRCFTDLDVSSEFGTIFGLVVRLATQRGYHRDPDIFGFSPFEKEMRRRTWSLCIQLDLLISFHLGLPSTIQFPTWDTRPPRNLLDSDFDENTDALPRTRPDSETTDILFYIAKHRLVTVFEKILRHSLSTHLDHVNEVDSLDAEIRDTYAALPDNLRPRPMAESVIDPASLIVTRLCVHFMYQKCLCVLHRRHATAGRTKSTRICYESASSLVQYFLDAYNEFQPGGLIESERWFMSSITWSDFLLGATALCLVLCVSSQNTVGYDIDLADIMNLLRRSRCVCEEQSKRSKDTQRVRSLIEATISHFGIRSDKDQPQVLSDDMDVRVDQPSSSSVPSSVTNTHYTLPRPNGCNGVHDDQTLLGESHWMWNDGMAGSINDASWTYLQHFLSLPNDDYMVDL